jgi:hypothetical protein
LWGYLLAGSQRCASSRQSGEDEFCNVVFARTQSTYLSPLSRAEKWARESGVARERLIPLGAI